MRRRTRRQIENALDEAAETAARDRVDSESHDLTPEEREVALEFLRFRQRVESDGTRPEGLEIPPEPIGTGVDPTVDATESPEWKAVAPVLIEASRRVRADDRLTLPVSEYEETPSDAVEIDLEWFRSLAEEIGVDPDLLTAETHQ